MKEKSKSQKQRDSRKRQRTQKFVRRSPDMRVLNELNTMMSTRPFKKGKK